MDRLLVGDGFTGFFAFFGFFFLFFPRPAFFSLNLLLPASASLALRCVTRHSVDSLQEIPPDERVQSLTLSLDSL